MGRRAKEKTEPRCFSEGLKRDRISLGFAAIYRMKRKIAELTEIHLKPLKDAKTKEWRNIKADTDTDSTDLDIAYRLYERRRLAKEMETELDAYRVRDNLKRAFAALKYGETLDFLDLVAPVSGEEDEDTALAAEAVNENELNEEEDDEPSFPADPSSSAPPEVEPEPWEEAAAAPPEEAVGSVAAFNAGSLAAQEGLTADECPYSPRSNAGKAWRKGWENYVVQIAAALSSPDALTAH